MRNTFKTAFLLTGLTLFLIFVGQIVGGERGAVFAFVLAAVMNFVSYFFSDKIALAMSGAQAGHRAGAAARLQHRAPAHAKGRTADAEAVRHSDRVAQRLCHRPQPASRLGRGHAKAF